MFFYVFFWSKASDLISNKDDRQILDLVIKNKGSFEILSEYINKISIWILKENSTQIIIKELKLDQLEKEIFSKNEQNFNYEKNFDKMLIHIAIKLHSNFSFVENEEILYKKEKEKEKEKKDLCKSVFLFKK